MFSGLAGFEAGSLSRNVFNQQPTNTVQYPRTDKASSFTDCEIGCICMCFQTNLLARHKESLCVVEYITDQKLTTIMQQQIEYTCFNYLCPLSLECPSWDSSLKNVGYK
jgi:hypothetical protein